MGRLSVPPQVTLPKKMLEPDGVKTMAANNSIIFQDPQEAVHDTPLEPCSGLFMNTRTS